MFGPLSFGSDDNVVESSRSVCLLCQEKYDLRLDREDFMNHLLESHSLIIKDSDCIIDLSGYVDYWRERLKTSSLKEICSDGAKAGSMSDPMVYILSDSIPEDKHLRERLNKQALEKALDQQRTEREDKYFKRKCLFCRHEIEPSRSVYLTHLSTSHNLQLGKPDNLVYTDKYLDIIESTLNNLRCIFCEKMFKDRNVLKEHMRKKLHKRVNPSNPIYDQFYMINYLAPGVSNKRLRERKRRKSPDDDEECDWSDWKEESNESIVCLFCTDKLSSWDSALHHLNQSHAFDFKTIASQLDFYQQVKLVNYIRHRVYRNQCITCDNSYKDRCELLSHLEEDGHLVKPSQHMWDQPEYFFPTYENDSFLYHLDDSTEAGLPSDDEEETRGESEGETLTGRRFTVNEKKSVGCLLCHYEDHDADNVLHHMYDSHGFDYPLYTSSFNFMDRVKLINYTKAELEKRRCLATDCRQVFADLNTLTEHMKHSNHFITPTKSLWIHDSCTGDGANVKASSQPTVDYLYALEGVSCMKKDVDIENEVKLSCFSDAEEEDSLPILCLFCLNQSSNWAQALSHLHSSHQFSYVQLTTTMSFYDQVKMVTYIRNMVNKSSCPACGAALSDRQALSKHMDTENHYLVPPRSSWDKSQFYPASFVGDPFLSELNVHHATDTLTTPLENVHHATDTLTTPLETTSPHPNNETTGKSADSGNVNASGSSSGGVEKGDDCGGSNDSDWGDWDEEMKIPVTCLLCPDVSHNWLAVHAHMKTSHHFSYLEISSGLTFYDQVKLVNYMRKKVAGKRCFMCDAQADTDQDLLDHCTQNKHLALPDKHLWNKDQYFQPFLENDGFLSHIDDGDSDDAI